MNAPVPVIDFAHRHAGHCESGVMASLLSHAGLPISEPMVLGLSAGLTFAHFPFVRIGGLPLTSYRMPPGAIARGLARRVGFRLQRRRFRSPHAAVAAVDEALAAGQPVGIQASVFWLPYFPPQMRFHFNAHNLIVHGREGDEYLVSDPVFEHPQRCSVEALTKARFIKGALAPRGLMYYPRRVPGSVDVSRALKPALRRTANMMLRTPVPFVGVRAIRRLARRIAQWPSAKVDARLARLQVGQIIRMQEEIGTGGGGFRFMYAAFLQEAGDATDNDALREASAAMTEAGDAWRRFALAGARIVREKNREADAYRALSDELAACATREEAVYRQLLRAV